jgi:hydrogenase maturation factor
VSERALPSGKLAPAALETRVLRYLGRRRADVLLHAALGEDAAAVSAGDLVCVLSSDPITGATCEAGWYAVHVACNDVAACGAAPVGVLLTLLFPPGAGESAFEAAMIDADRAARELCVEILGGHSESTPAVTRLVISATAVGVCPRARLTTSAGARPGDSLVLTKTAGLEGTAILAGDCFERVAAALGADLAARARAFTGALSVVAEALAAVELGVTAMHDATEGGVLGAAYELAASSGVRLVVDAAAVPVAPETSAICRLAAVDPLRLIASGALLATARDGAALVAGLRARGFSAAVIGRAEAGPPGLTLLGGGSSGGNGVDVPAPIVDELWRARARLGVAGD